MDLVRPLEGKLQRGLEDNLRPGEPIEVSLVPSIGRDLAGQIADLSRLRDKGVLNDAEFLRQRLVC